MSGGWGPIQFQAWYAGHHISVGPPSHDPQTEPETGRIALMLSDNFTLLSLLTFKYFSTLQGVDALVVPNKSRTNEGRLDLPDQRQSWACGHWAFVLGRSARVGVGKQAFALWQDFAAQVPTYTAVIQGTRITIAQFTDSKVNLKKKNMKNFLKRKELHDKIQICHRG